MEQFGQNNEEMSKNTEQEAPSTQAAKSEAQLKAEMEQARLRAQLGEKSVIETPARKTIVEPTYNPNAQRPDDMNTMTNEEMEALGYNSDNLLQPEIPEVIKKIPETKRKNDVTIQPDGTKIIKRSD